MLQPLYNLFATIFRWIDSFIGNYAWSIILMTLMLKLVLLPFDFRQKSSALKMRALQPKLEKIQKKYKNDKEKFAQKQMELYKTERVSPFSGCLPLLITMPIFFAFFGALRMIAADQLAELYVAMQTADITDTQSMHQLVKGWLWIQNIWQPDAFSFLKPGVTNVIPTMTDALITQYSKISTAFASANITAESFNTVMQPLTEYFQGVRLGWNGFYILPVLAAATSLIFSKLQSASNPQPPSADGKPNPMSSKLMQYLFPAMSLIFCSTSNSVFSIYWLFSNIFSIGSNFLTDKVLAAKAKKKAEMEAAETGDDIL